MNHAGVPESTIMIYTSGELKVWQGRQEVSSDRSEGGNRHGSH